MAEKKENDNTADWDNWEKKIGNFEVGSSGLVLKIHAEKKHIFAESIFGLVEDRGKTENAGAILTALEETSVMHYANMGDVMSDRQVRGQWDVYLEMIRADDLSRYINRLAEKSPYFQLLYHALACYIIEKGFGEYVKPEELVPEPPKPEDVPEPVKLGKSAIARLKEIQMERGTVVADPDTAAAGGYRGRRR